MICISIAQESRRMALVDMLNATPQCDLIEMRLDRFENAPDIKELLAHKKRPIIFSCKRPQDGGRWKGSENERLALLRQCVLNKPEFVEIELDVADQIRPLPPVKRIISYTNLEETPANIAEIHQLACTKKPDVVQLVTKVRNSAEALPLVPILIRTTVPTVVIGLGKPGLMLAVLGKKLQSPWTYAALEKGMETYLGQPTIHALDTVYHYRAVERSTRLIGVNGSDVHAYGRIAAVNAGMARLEQPIRCLPLEVADAMTFAKVAAAVKKMDGVLVDEPHRPRFQEVAKDRDAAALLTRQADLLIRQEGTWHAHDTFPEAAVNALANQLLARSGNPASPFGGRQVLIVGINGLAQAVAAEIQRRGGALTLASREKKAALELAKHFGCRFVQFEALYSTSHDVLAVCADERLDREETDEPTWNVHPGYLRPHITVMDLTRMDQRSPFLRDAETRGCPVVTPEKIMLEQMALQVEKLSGQPAPRAVMDEAWNTIVDDEMLL